MKKRMNFRYFFVLLLSLILVIYFFVNIFENTYLKLTLIITMLIGCIVIFCLYKKLNNKNLLIAFSMIVLIIITSLNIFGRILSLDRLKEFDGKDVAIRGRISSNYSLSSSGNLKIIISDIEISSGEKYSKINGKLDFYIEKNNLDLTKIEVGKIFETKTTINFYNFSTITNKNKLSNRVLGYGFSKSSDFKIVGSTRLTLKELANNYVYTKFCNWNMEYAGLGLAMIFGNTAYIGGEISEIFNNIGIAHLVAVSGLNISILIGIFTFILKKLKLSRKSQLIINFVILFIYSYLCSFTISVVRATVMALLLLYGKMRGKPTDNLSICSFSASLFLIINPFLLFNYSFILSYSTVLTITLLYRTLKRFFDKMFYRSLSDSISLTLSVESWLIFVQIYLFKTFPIVSILSNTFLVPIAVFAFELLLIFTPIALIFPFMAFTLKSFDILMSIVIRFGNWLNGIGTILTISNISLITVVLTFLFLLISSDYVFESKKTKCLSLMGLTVIIIGFQLIYSII